MTESQPPTRQKSFWDIADPVFAVALIVWNCVAVWRHMYEWPVAVLFLSGFGVMVLLHRRHR